MFKWNGVSNFRRLKIFPGFFVNRKKILRENQILYRMCVCLNGKLELPVSYAAKFNWKHILKCLYEIQCYISQLNRIYQQQKIFTNPYLFIYVVSYLHIWSTMAACWKKKKPGVHRDSVLISQERPTFIDWSKRKFLLNDFTQTVSFKLSWCYSQRKKFSFNIYMNLNTKRPSSSDLASKYIFFFYSIIHPIQFYKNSPNTIL